MNILFVFLPIIAFAVASQDSKNFFKTHYPYYFGNVTGCYADGRVVPRKISYTDPTWVCATDLQNNCAQVVFFNNALISTLIENKELYNEERNDHLFVSFNGCFYCANRGSHIRYTIIQQHEKGSYWSDCVEESEAISNHIYGPTWDSQYRTHFIAGVLAKRRCRHTAFFKLIKTDNYDDVATVYKNTRLKIEHDCSNHQSVIEEIVLPELNAVNYMTRRLEINLGLVNLSNQMENETLYAELYPSKQAVVSLSFKYAKEKDGRKISAKLGYKTQKFDGHQLTRRWFHAGFSKYLNNIEGDFEFGSAQTEKYPAPTMHRNVRFDSCECGIMPVQTTETPTTTIDQYQGLFPIHIRTANAEFFLNKAEFVAESLFEKVEAHESLTDLKVLCYKDGETYMKIHRNSSLNFLLLRSIRTVYERPNIRLYTCAESDEEYS